MSTPSEAPRPVVKFVFIQDDPFFLPKVLDKYLREFSGSTAGIHVQPNNQGKRTLWETAMALYEVYGLSYFQYKLGRFAVAKAKAKIVNGLLGSTRTCYSVAAVAKKYGVPVHVSDDVNTEDFRAKLRDLGVELIVSVSGTQFYKKPLRAQTRLGIINCHGALLPKYRGLMPSFWTLANGETMGGVSVHFVDDKLDNGPIVVRRAYRIHPSDTLEDIMARSKDLAAECIIDAVRLIEAGDPKLIENPAEEASSYSMPKREDVERFRRNGHRFF